MKYIVITKDTKEVVKEFDSAVNARKFINKTGGNNLV